MSADERGTTGPAGEGADASEPGHGSGGQSAEGRRADSAGASGDASRGPFEDTFTRRGLLQWSVPVILAVTLPKTAYVQSGGHGDAGHGDAGHGDAGHSDTGHSDVHADSHSDTGHTDTGHTDTGQTVHLDSPHIDTHIDTPHVDTNITVHADTPHGDFHGDQAHVDHTDMA